MTSGNKGVQLLLEYRFSICLVVTKLCQIFPIFLFLLLRKKEKRRNQRFSFTSSAKEALEHRLEVGYRHFSSLRTPLFSSQCVNDTSEIFDERTRSAREKSSGITGRGHSR